MFYGVNKKMKAIEDRSLDEFRLMLAGRELVPIMQGGWVSTFRPLRWRYR